MVVLQHNRNHVCGFMNAHNDGVLNDCSAMRFDGLKGGEGTYKKASFLP